MDLEKIKSKKSTEELLNFSIINLDKPTGPTSFWNSQFVKKALVLKKTSHLGTLDPMVTGVLPIALNRACRLNEYLMHRNKNYVGIMRAHSIINKKDLEKVVDSFLGKITQMPPVKSRVKRAERVREIISFKILEQRGKDFLFESEVQAGTYIRKLIHDIGLKIGGAHMIELRRIKAGIFDESDLINLYDFEKAVEYYKKGDDKGLRKILIPGEIISKILPVVEIKKETIKKILSGSPIFDNFLSKKYKFNEGEKICIFHKTRFIGCYKVVNSGKIFAKPEFVFN